MSAMYLTFEIGITVMILYFIPAFGCFLVIRRLESGTGFFRRK